MGTGGGAVIVHTARLLIACGGKGEARAPTLVLHTLGMHVDFSFSYLRVAEAVSFDIKKSYIGAIQRVFHVVIPDPPNSPALLTRRSGWQKSGERAG